MRLFRDLSLQNKLLAVVGVVLAITASSSGLALLRFAHLRDAAEALAHDALQVAALQTEINAVQAAHYGAAASTTGAAQADAIAAARSAHLRLRTALDALGGQATGRPGREHLDTLRRAVAAQEETWRTMESSLRAGDSAGSRATALAGTTRLSHQMQQATAALLTASRQDVDAASATAGDLFATARRDMLIGVVVSVLVGVTLARVVARRITGSLAQVAAVATSLQANCLAGTRRALDGLSRGDMSVRTTPVTMPTENTDSDEIGELARTCDRMIVDVKAVLAAVTVTQERVECMVADAIRLVQAARDGALDVRADASKYEGSYRVLVSGLNDTLEAVATPMAEVSSVLDRVAAQDLSRRVVGTYRGTFTTVASGVNTAIDSLDATLVQVNSAAGQLSHATSEITTGAQVLASGASEQAASLEEISSSMHVFAAETRQTAGSAREASTLAASARAEAADGSERMERLSSAVRQIRDASAATARIVRTIDDIAFQTNLLALNAAVEAARAGDAGRGFAVVADEVRALALRAAEAAHSTTDLIEQGQVAADRGVRLNEEVTESLTRIHGHIVRVAAVTEAISEAGLRQDAGVTQILTAVDQINMVTQQVAASAEESASAATELSGQAASLRETVARFTLTGAQPAPVRGTGTLPFRSAATGVVYQTATRRPPGAARSHARHAMR